MNRSFSLLRTPRNLVMTCAMLAFSGGIAVAAPPATPGFGNSKPAATALVGVETTGTVTFSSSDTHHLQLQTGKSTTTYERSSTGGWVGFGANATDSKLVLPSAASVLPPSTTGLIWEWSSIADYDSKLTAVPAQVGWSSFTGALPYVKADGTIGQAKTQNEKSGLKLLRISLSRNEVGTATAPNATGTRKYLYATLRDYLKASTDARVVGETWLAVAPQVLSFILMYGEPSLGIDSSNGSFRLSPNSFALKKEWSEKWGNEWASKFVAKYGYMHINVPPSALIAFRKYKPVWADSTKTTISSFADDVPPSK